MSQSKPDIRITARVTERERQRIADNAKKCGLSVSEYIKQRALGFEPKPVLPDAFFQVVVTTHLNTDNLHNHFVVNSVSFKDGTKFRDKIGDHMELRRISHEICRELGLGILENSDFYSRGKKKEYWMHRQGIKTHADLLREDVEYCSNYASNGDEFEKQLRGLGYEIDFTRMSVKAKGWGRAKRLSTLGFTDEVIRERLQKNCENLYFHTAEWNYHLPYKPKRFPLESEMRRLGFTIEHTHDTATLVVNVLFLLIITVIKTVMETADVMLLSPDLRYAAKDLKEFVDDFPKTTLASV